MRRSRLGTPSLLTDYDTLMKHIQDNTLTLKQIEEIEKQLERAKVAARDTARQTMKKFASDLGFTLYDLFPSPKNKRALAPKFANPDDPTETWSGQGRIPIWLRKKIGDRPAKNNPELEKYRIKE